MRDCACIDEAAHYRRVSRGSMIVLHAEGFCSEERGGELAQFRLQLAFALLGIGRRTDSRLYASPSPRSEPHSAGGHPSSQTASQPRAKHRLRRHRSPAPGRPRKPPGAPVAAGACRGWRRRGARTARSPPRQAGAAVPHACPAAALATRAATAAVRSRPACGAQRAAATAGGELRRVRRRGRRWAPRRVAYGQHSARLKFENAIFRSH